MKCIRIVNWDELFEVNFHGGIFVEGDRRRMGPLDYVRVLVNAADWPLWYRRLMVECDRVVVGDLAQTEIPALKHAPKMSGSGHCGYAVYMKGIELSAYLPGALRGLLLEDARSCVPLTAELFGAHAGFSRRCMEIGWRACLGAGLWEEVDVDVDELRRRPRAYSRRAARESVAGVN